jgi:alkylation response protein AidB-like acyl-CoA dehydrogenase
MFRLSDEYEAFRESIRSFAEAKIAPNAEEADRTATFPQASFDAIRDAGFAGVPYPARVGGDDADPIAQGILLEELARVCASTSLFIIASKLGAIPIIEWGSEDLAQEVLGGLAAGEYVMSYCLSEAEAGSDVASMTTRAVRDGSDYLITGRKMWITNAGRSEWYTVFAKTDPDAGHRGISAFVVHKDDPGFSVGKLESKMGMKGSPTGEVIFDSVRVPQRRMIGEENRGFYYALGTLDRSRPNIGAQAVGIAQGAIDAASSYVDERRQFDQRIVDFQAIQFMIADAVMHIEAARGLVYSALSEVMVKGPRMTELGAMAKCFAADVAMAATTDAVQMLGGYGYTTDFPVERMMRDAKLCQIYEGTNQVQRGVVARQYLARRGIKA